MFRDFLYTSCPNTYVSLPLSTSPPEWYSCYDWYNLHWHIIIIQIPKFTIGFTLGVVHFMGLFKCILIFCQHYSIIQKIFTALKILCALSSHFSPKIIFLKPGIMQLLRQNSYRKKLKSAKPKICSPKLTIKNQD